MALVTYEDPVILDSTGQAIVSALQDIAASGGSGGGASSTSIAPIESSTTASKAYAVGDLLFYNNILYKVTSAISQGGTITISGNNANVTDTDIDSELKTKQPTTGVVSKQGAGLAPQLPNEDTTTKYLRQDGTWAVPPDNNTWTAMVGATSETDGTAGYAPAPPLNGYNTKYLRADGTWAVPADTKTVAGLEDTAVTSPANKQILEYNSTTSKWENKNKCTILTATLEAGETELEITNAAITSTARIDVYFWEKHIPLLDQSRDGTTLTLTIPEQEEDLDVEVIIHED